MREFYYEGSFYDGNLNEQVTRSMKQQRFPDVMVFSAVCHVQMYFMQCNI